MATTTVLDLIKGSLADIGVLQPGESAEAADAAIALDRLNDWIDGLKLEGLTVYTNSRATWSITSASSYTVGSGATVNIARPPSPNDILAIGFQETSVSPAWERLVDLLDEGQYEAIVMKSMTSQYPLAWYYNPTYAAGFGALIPYPIPTSSTLLGVIYVPAPIDEYATTATVLALPPGYRRFLRSNLAVELAPAFDQPLTPQLIAAATSSKERIKASNYRMGELSTGRLGQIFGRSGKSNIYTGST